VFLWSAVVWTLDVLTAVLVLAALTGGIWGVRPDADAARRRHARGQRRQPREGAPALAAGGIGLYEAAFTGLVVSTTGLPVETALAAAILDHALKNAVTLAGGGVAALALGLSPTAGPLQATATPDRKPSPETGQRTRPERASCRIPDRQIFLG